VVREIHFRHTADDVRGALERADEALVVVRARFGPDA